MCHTGKANSHPLLEL